MLKPLKCYDEAARRDSKISTHKLDCVSDSRDKSSRQTLTQAMNGGPHRVWATFLSLENRPPTDVEGAERDASSSPANTPHAVRTTLIDLHWLQTGRQQQLSSHTPYTLPA